MFAVADSVGMRTHATSSLPLNRSISESSSVSASSVVNAMSGALVAAPMWRQATPLGRARGAILVFVAAWLALWGYVEDKLDLHFDAIDDWHWDNEVVDLVRWVGWIPIACLMHRKLLPAPRVATERA